MILLLASIMTEIYRFNQSGSYPIKLYAGQYTVRCYGAQGGNTYNEGVLYNNTGGHGAYARGTMTVTGTGTTFYAYVGGMGKSNKNGNSEGGFNGGGYSGEDTATGKDDGAGGGGGATDLRIDDQSIDSRIIVAGGGAGGAWSCKGSYAGKYKVICPTSNNVYTESDSSKDYNKDGTGGKGDYAMGQPGSGGGGGYLGGRGGEWCNQIGSSYYAVGCGGSSYVSGDEHFEKNEKMSFFNIEIYPNHNAGDGLLIIEEDFKCSSNCQSCTSNKNCTSCFDGYFLYEGKCYEKCPESTFSDSATTCAMCDMNCETCSETSIHCTSCKEGNFLQDSMCVARCKEGSAPSGNKCVSCKHPCKTCTFSPNECDMCVDGYVRHENDCVSECPENYVMFENSCELCQGGCKTCIGSPTHCTSCKKDFFLYNNECVASCPNKMFAKDGVCVNCNYPCDACKSNEMCLTCASGLLLYDGFCYESCPEGTTTSQSGLGCIKDDL